MKSISCAFLILLSLPLHSQTKTFIREYTYSAGEADSKITSRAIALDQVKRILLEEIGIYLHSEMKTVKEEKNDVFNELTTQQIQSITAGITETKIVNEKWNGEQYYIKASIAVNPDEVNKNISRIGADQNKLKELMEVKQKADDAYAEIERLREELLSTKSVNERLAKEKQYVITSNNLSATDWYQKGYNAYELKELDNAFLYFQKAIELNPKYDFAYNALGILHYDKGYYDKAISLYEKALELNPKLEITYINLGNAYFIKNDIVKAIVQYEKSIKLNPNYAESYFGLGTTSVQKGDNDEAISFFEKAIELNPNFYSAYLHLGYTYYSKRDIDKAIIIFKKAIEISPKSDGAYNNLGILYFEKGYVDEAISLYEKAIECNPKNDRAYHNLGNAYFKNGNLKKQIENYTMAAQLGNQESQKWLNDNGYTW